MNMHTIKGMLIGFVLLFSHGVLAGQTVNINTASAEELAEALDGVGEARAEAIVSFREENGGFLSPEDLALISGIGENTVERNRDRIQVDD